MLLPARMTQRGGICSDSQRITYTAAAGGSAETPVHARCYPTESEGGKAEAASSHPGTRKKLGKLVIKLPSPHSDEREASPPPSL